MSDQRRESQRHGGSGSPYTRDTDQSTVVLHDSVCDGETKPRTTCFRRVKRLEQAGQCVLRYAHAGVPHGNFDPMFPIGRACDGCDMTMATLRHGMEGVDDDVHQSLTDLRLIAQHRRYIVLDRIFEVNLVLLRFKLHECDDMLDHSMKVYFTSIQEGGTRELHKIIKDGGETSAFSIQDLHIMGGPGRERALVLQFLLEKVEVQIHGAQRVA